LEDGLNPILKEELFEKSNGFKIWLYRKEVLTDRTDLRPLDLAGKRF
jgi:hypothetical protein